MSRLLGGFTIIETMLFLGISGILIVSLLAGTGVTIGIQRYRDSVETFKSFLQGQYSELASVRNDRDQGWTCDQNAQTTVVNPSAGIPLGQSDCVLVGRYVTVKDTAITTYSVTAREIKPAPAGQTTDTQVSLMAKNYNYNVASDTKEDTALEWSSRIAWPRAGANAQAPDTSRSLTLLFIRSPIDGEIYTFTSNAIATTPTPAVLKSLIVAGTTYPGQGEQTICINTSGPLAGLAPGNSILGADQSVYVYPAATGPSSIETRSNDFIDQLDGRADGVRTTTC